MKKLKNVIVVILLALFIMGVIVFFVEQRKALLNINVEPAKVSFKINNKEYKNIDAFKKKVSPGKYEVEISKENYETYKKTLTVKRGEQLNLKIVLDVNKETKTLIKKSITQFIKKQPFIKSLKHEEKITKFQDNYAEVEIIFAAKIESENAILKKENNQWKIIEMGTGIDLETFIKEIPKKKLIEKLPYVEESFEVDYIGYLDQFYVTIKKEPLDKTKKISRAWFDKQGVDRKAITIKWVISPLLMDNQKPSVE